MKEDDRHSKQTSQDFSVVKSTHRYPEGSGQSVGPGKHGSKVEIAKQFGIASSTLSTIIKDRKRLN